MTTTRNIDRWASLVGSVVVPTGILTALLFYFGYASTKSQYEYFGVDVDAVGMDTQEFLMRSARPLLVPLLLVTLVGIGGIRLHINLNAFIQANHQDVDRTRRLLAFRGVATKVMLVGAAIVSTSIVAILVYPLLSDWSFYTLITPLLLAVGVVLLAYTGKVRDTLDRNINGSVDLDGRANALRQLSLILSGIVVAGCAFWATATLAQWSGRGQAAAIATQFSKLPLVILDTKERLYVGDAVIKETALPMEAGQSFRYRYRNLRLLIEGSERLFLVPDRWSNNATTLVVPMNDSVRIQFQFQNPA
jgi:hypothetical protein